MVTRLKRLLLVCAMFFMMFREAFRDESLSYVGIIIELMLALQPSILHIQTVGVRTSCKTALKSVCPLLTSTHIRYLASIGLLVRLFIIEAARKPIFPPWTKKHGHNKLKIRMDSHGLYKVRLVQKSLATFTRRPHYG